MFTLFVVTNFITTAQENLGYKLQVGDTFSILQEASQEIIQEIPGAPQTITNELRGLLQFKVIEVSPSLFTIEVSFKKFSMRMSSPTLGEMISIDTEIPSEDFEYKMFVGMLDKPMQMRMKATGEIVEIKNGDAIINGMIDSMKDLDEETKQAMRLQLEKEWKAEVLAKSFEQMTFIYPNSPKKVGETWENSYTGENKIHAKNLWTYLKNTQTKREFSAQSTITMDLSTEAITLDLKGTQTSQTTASIRSGFIDKLSVKSIASGNAQIPNTPDMKIPTTINSITTYTLQ